MTSKFIQKALSKHKKGALHKQLGIIPWHTIDKQLLVDIKNANINSYIRPSEYQHADSGDVKVTRLLKKRAILALTLKNIRR